MDQSFTINKEKRMHRNSYEYERGYKAALDSIQFSLDVAVFLLKKQGDEHSNNIAEKLQDFLNQR